MACPIGMGILVYRYEIYDRVSRSFSLTQEWATPEYIEALPGVALPSTNRVVDAEHVTPEGRYIGPPLE
jgi:hypothetical protein